MKLISSICLLFVGVSLVHAIDNLPLDLVPYCASITNGIVTDPAGNRLNLTLLNSPAAERSPIAHAMYINGQNLPGPLSVDAFLRHKVFFFSLDGKNNTRNIIPNGSVWDFALYEGFGAFLIDGTYDTFDVAMQLVIDEESVAGSVFEATCSADSYGFSTSGQTASGLKVTRHFYVAPGPDDAWARVVDVITNPTASAITSVVSYHNSFGSDEKTVFYVVNDRHSVSGDSEIDSELEDNPLSIHWSGKNAQIPQVTGWINSPTNGSNTVTPYWNVAIPAGETVTFMLVATQGGMSIEKTVQSAAALDANPIRLYFGMTDQQLSTLQNFNACATSLPENGVNVVSQSACTSNGGSATYSVTWANQLVNSGFKVVAKNTQDGSSVTSSDNKLSLTAGTYDLFVSYGSCSFAVTDVTVTCPETPQSAASSASLLTASGLLMTAAAFLF
jgi:hypothetical protein